MSCGNPHEVDCVKILGRVYEYIDNEMAGDDCAQVRRHLDECGPCLEKYGLEQLVKALVHRACGCDRAPNDLRTKVLYRIEQVRYEISVGWSVPSPGESPDDQPSPTNQLSGQLKDEV